MEGAFSASNLNAVHLKVIVSMPRLSISLVRHQVLPDVSQGLQVGLFPLDPVRAGQVLDVVGVCGLKEYEFR